MLRHVSDGARARRRDFSWRENVRGLLQFSTRVTFSVVNGINASFPGRRDVCFDSRYWNSIDGEKILIISSPVLSARVTENLREEKERKIDYKAWKWNQSGCQLGKYDLTRMQTFIHVCVNFYLHWYGVYWWNFFYWLFCSIYILYLTIFYIM